MKKVYIIDDDHKLNSLVTKYLSQYEYTVYSEIDPLIALDNYTKLNPDILILDVMMPGIDGFEFCRRIRAESKIPILMLTARTEVTDRIVGLELGADDYLGKPFEPRELLARIQAIHRRTDFSSSYGNNSISFNENSQKICINDKHIELTTMEFYLFKFFFENRGNVVTRNMIFDRLKGLDADNYDRSIDVLVSRLRHKIEDNPKKPELIKTVWGKGYRFIG